MSTTRYVLRQDGNGEDEEFKTLEDVMRRLKASPGIIGQLYEVVETAMRVDVRFTRDADQETSPIVVVDATPAESPTPAKVVKAGKGVTRRKRSQKAPKAKALGRDLGYGFKLDGTPKKPPGRKANGEARAN